MWGAEFPSLARFLCVFLAGCLLLTSFPALAQEETPVFRSDTTLVEFTVAALDKGGNPVTDLAQDEVVVKDKGRRRDLAFFRYEGGEDAPSPPPLPAGVFTNRAENTPGPPRNITAILVDMLNTTPEDQLWVKSQVMRYLRELAPDTRIAIYVLGNNLTVLHDFTNDTESLRARIQRAEIKLESQLTENISVMAREAEALLETFPPDMRELATETLISQMETQMLADAQVRLRRAQYSLESLERLGDHLAGIPGRKSLVWISGGISMLSVTGQIGFGGRGQIKSIENSVRDTSRRLAHQGVTLYMVDARGLRGYDPTASPSGQPGRGQMGPFARLEQAAELSADPLPAMYKMARITGGRVFWNTNDMAAGIKAVASDTKGTYSLGFYVDGEAPASKDADEWRDLKVEVKRKGVKLQHRQGYLAEPPAAAPLDWTEEQWQSAIYNPIGSTGLRLDAVIRHGTLAELSAMGMDPRNTTGAATAVKSETAPPEAAGSDSDTGEERAMLMLQIVADDLVFRPNGNRPAAQVDVAIVEKLPDGNYRMQQEPLTLPRPANNATNPPVVSFRHMWELVPEASTIRLIVRDRFTGRYGTLDLPVKSIPGIVVQN